MVSFGFLFDLFLLRLLVFVGLKKIWLFGFWRHLFSLIALLLLLWLSCAEVRNAVAFPCEQPTLALEVQSDRFLCASTSVAPCLCSAHQPLQNCTKRQEKFF